MTDNEIIKALEICGDQTMEDGHCINCPCKDACYGEEGIHALEKAALGLIRRQQTEIENLKKRVGKFKTYAKEAWAEMESEDDVRKSD